MSIVNAPGEALAEMNAREAQFDIDALFRAHYRRVARMIARNSRRPLWRGRGDGHHCPVGLRVEEGPEAAGAAGW
jgi:hypothetical protein